ncbi:hypothetical protein FA95DRAFT_302914 [Auriscalpium vulgare]|uniref:Uncharacterized protein n=1 Tax=Auriscalpium vulgare TaxID=40419 RepID=A0ACB8RJM3_9AGAM|nr:hypothetical protein FA95DRAFT_302914 [Auriscalpium vulgare]
MNTSHTRTSFPPAAAMLTSPTQIARTRNGLQSRYALLQTVQVSQHHRSGALTPFKEHRASSVQTAGSDRRVRRAAPPSKTYPSFNELPLVKSPPSTPASASRPTRQCDVSQCNVTWTMGRKHKGESTRILARVMSGDIMGIIVDGCVQRREGRRTLSWTTNMKKTRCDSDTDRGANRGRQQTKRRARQKVSTKSETRRKQNEGIKKSAHQLQRRLWPTAEDAVNKRLLAYPQITRLASVAG